MMLRTARAAIRVLPPPQVMRRRAAAGTASDHIEIDPAKLYIVVTALHWEQADQQGRYKGNSNGDFFEGGRNVVWECHACKKPFLKYPDEHACPHCGSAKINDWEADLFGRKGELLTRHDSGKFVYETWNGCPVHENHDERVVIGQIEDVWTDMGTKSIEEMLSIDRRKNDRLARKVEAGSVTDTSMGVLVGVSVCSHCFNVATDEEKWCHCLRRHKGRAHPASGQPVFEILKNIQGAEHSIISVGYGADGAAKMKKVLASGKTILLPAKEDHIMPVPGREIKRNPNAAPYRTVADRRSSATSAGGSSAPVASYQPQHTTIAPDGTLDSTRSAARLMAQQSPDKLRREIAAMLAALAKQDPAAAAQMRQQAGLTAAAPKAYRLAADPLKRGLARLVAAGVAPSRRVAKALSYLPHDVLALGEVVRRVKAGKRRQIAQMLAGDAAPRETDDAQLADLVRDVVIDEAIQHAQDIAADIGAVAEESVTEVIEALTDTAFDEQDLSRSLDELAEDPAILTVHEIPDEGVEAVVNPTEEPDPMKKLAVNTPAPAENRAPKPESSPTAPPAVVNEVANHETRMEDSRAPHPEDFPTAEPDEQMSVKAAAVESNPDDVAVEALPKPTKPATEHFPEADRASADATEDVAPRDMDSEDNPVRDAQDDGDELNVEPMETPRKLSPEKANPDLYEGPPKVATPDTHPEPEHFPMIKAAIAKMPVARRAAAAADPRTPRGVLQALARDKDRSVAWLARAQLDDPKGPDDLSLKGKDGKTPTTPEGPLAAKGEDHLTQSSDRYPNGEAGGDKPTKPGAAPFAGEAVDGEKPTPVGALPFPNEAVDGEEITESTDRYPDGEALKQSKLTARLVENKQPGQRSASFWEVRANAQPIMRVTAAAAFGDEVIENWNGSDGFASPNYRDTLLAEVRRLGARAVNKEHFMGRAEVLRPRTAQAAPAPVAGALPPPAATPPPAPANLPPQQVAELTADTPAEAPLTSVLAKVLAPLFADSPTGDTQSKVAELVQLLSDQDMVTELATKLDAEVRDLQPEASNEPPPPPAPENFAPAGGTAVPSEAKPMSVGAAAGRRRANVDPATAAYLKEAYPDGLGAELVKAGNKTDADTTPDRKLAALEKENRRLQAELTANLRYDRCLEVARRAQAAGMIPALRDFRADGQSESVARKASQTERESEAKRLLALDEAGFRHACRLVDAAWTKHQAALSQTRDRPQTALLDGIVRQATASGDVDDPTRRGGSRTRLAGFFSSAVDADKIEQGLQQVNMRKQ